MRQFVKGNQNGTHRLVKASAMSLLTIILLVTACRTGPTTPPPDPVKYLLGQESMGYKFGWPDLSDLAQLRDRSQVAMTFYETSWCRIQPDEGAYDWKRLDRIVQKADQAALELTLKIRVGSCWATGDVVEPSSGVRDRHPSKMPLDMDAYQSMIRDVVNRYTAKIDTFAIENEVNAAVFWEGTPTQYSQLLQSGVAAIRSVAPDATITDAGLSSTAYGDALAADMLRTNPDLAVAYYTAYYARRSSRTQHFPPATTIAELETALATDQAKRNIEYVNTTFEAFRTLDLDVYQLHFYEHYSNLEGLIDFLEDNLQGQPIHALEFGIYLDDTLQTDGDVKLAGEVAMLLRNMLGAGVKVSSFLPTNSSSVENEIRWGLVAPNFTSRHSGEVFSAVSSMAAQGGVVASKSHDGTDRILELTNASNETLRLTIDDNDQVSVAYS